MVSIENLSKIINCRQVVVSWNFPFDTLMLRAHSAIHQAGSVSSHLL